MGANVQIQGRIIGTTPEQQAELLCDSAGVLLVAMTAGAAGGASGMISKTIAAVAVTAGVPATIWTPTGGKKFRLFGFMLSLTVAGSVILIDNATEFARTPLMAAGIGLASPSLGTGYLSAAINQLLKIDVTANGSVSGFVYGSEE